MREGQDRVAPQGEIMLFRQGDLFVETVAAIPDGAVEESDLILAEGELTGHAHRLLRTGSARLLRHGSRLFVEVTAASAQLVHDEHAPLALERGLYRAWRQREYVPRQVRTGRVVFD